MVHLGIGGQFNPGDAALYYFPTTSEDEINFMESKKMIMMQKRDVFLTAVFSSLVAILLIVGIAAACYFYHKRRRKQEDDSDDDSPEGGQCSRVETAVTTKKSKLNGFLSLKTPLISTKTLGDYIVYHSAFPWCLIDDYSER